MRYASVCSGIEAASVAWHRLGWKPVWFSQYDPENNYKKKMDFPSRVLAARFPEVPNLGDMTKLNDHKTYHDEYFDVLVGGTPCQAFSIAGLRNGLSDERSNLALEFVRILEYKRPTWFVWENVPGVLTSGKQDNGTKDPGRDFACLLSAWTGQPISAQKFTAGGIIEAISHDYYSIAWRIFDSQYFGVPQRRRRVFVVGHLGKDWRPPVAVLFERESLRRDFTPGKKARKNTARNTEEGAGNNSSGGGYKWWDGSDTAATITRRSADQTMPDKANFQAVIRNINVEDTHPCLTKQISEQSGQDLGQPGALIVGEVEDDIFHNKVIIRRLTPLECERLQGFPDGWCSIEGATDSNIYAATGNSMTADVMEWIGSRIHAAEGLSLLK